MCLRFLGRYRHFLLQVDQAGIRRFLFCEEHSEIQVRLSAFIAAVALPGYGRLKGLDRLLRLIKTLIGQPKIVLCFYVMHIELKAGMKSIDDYGKPILVLLGAAEIVPAVRIRGIRAERLR